MCVASSETGDVGGVGTGKQFDELTVGIANKDRVADVGRVEYFTAEFGHEGKDFVDVARNRDVREAPFVH